MVAVAGGGTLGLIGAGATAGLTATVAGADSTSFTMTCHLGLAPIITTATFKATLKGTLPTSASAGQSLTLSGYGASMVIPQAFTTLGTGITLSGTISLDLTATGATPASQASTLTIPHTKLHKGTAPTVTLAGTVGSFTAGSTGGAATISSATTASLYPVVTGNKLGTGKAYPCTLPATVIAKVTAAAPKTKVTSVLPNAGPLAGGTTTVISGVDFTGATAVDFGTTPATAFTVTSGERITATVPAHSAGTVDVTVTSPDGTSTTNPADHFTYTNGPIVTGVSPSYGPRAGGTAVTITGLQFTGATTVAFDLSGATTVKVVSATKITAVSPAHSSAVVTVTVTSPKGTSITSVQDQFTYGLPGYYEVASDGGIFAFGTLGFYGSMGGKPLNAPIVAMATTPTGKGYWEVASDGGVFAFGTASFYGSMGGKPLNAPIVAMATTPTGKGYWLVASDGGIFAFGNAPFYGSTGAVTLPAPVVSMVANPNGTGYWEVGATGTIYSFGTPGLFGSMGGRALNAPIVGAASTPDFYGDWEVASDGGIFAFGNAPFYGSMGGQALNKPVVGMAPAPGGQGYWEVASDGGIFSFGTASFYGSMGGKPLNAPVVGIAVV